MFPWYPKELNPNSSCHFQTKAKKKAIYKNICYYTTLEAKIPQGQYTELHLTFFKPNRRPMDLDNMLAAMKSGLDGMCQALKIDDKVFKKITIEVAEELAGIIKVDLK